MTKAVDENWATTYNYTYDTTDSVQVGDTTVTFGHGGRHPEGAELTTAQVNQTIANNVVTRNLEVGQFIPDGNVVVSGYEVAYTAKKLTRALINVGTYHILTVN